MVTFKRKLQAKRYQNFLIGVTTAVLVVLGVIIFVCLKPGSTQPDLRGQTSHNDHNDMTTNSEISSFEHDSEINYILNDNYQCSSRPLSDSKTNWYSTKEISSPYLKHIVNAQDNKVVCGLIPEICEKWNNAENNIKERLSQYTLEDFDFIRQKSNNKSSKAIKPSHIIRQIKNVGFAVKEVKTWITFIKDTGLTDFENKIALIFATTSSLIYLNTHTILGVFGSALETYSDENTETPEVLNNLKNITSTVYEFYKGIFYTATDEQFKTRMFNSGGVCSIKDWESVISWLYTKNILSQMRFIKNDLSTIALNEYFQADVLIEIYTNANETQIQQLLDSIEKCLKQLIPLFLNKDIPLNVEALHRVNEEFAGYIEELEKYRP